MKAFCWKYIANITFKEFTKWCFAIWFYNVIKTMGKGKEKDGTYVRKKAEEKQNIVTIMISVVGKGTAFPVKLKLEEESFEYRY